MGRDLFKWSAVIITCAAQKESNALTQGKSPEFQRQNMYCMFSPFFFVGYGELPCVWGSFYFLILIEQHPLTRARVAVSATFAMVGGGQNDPPSNSKTRKARRPDDTAIDRS